MLYEKDAENPNFNPYYYFLNGRNDVGVASPSLATGFDTGLQFNRMRCYNPNLGRFTPKDKLTNKNYFLYATNNPAIFHDPLGLLPPGVGRFSWVMPLENLWCDQPACGGNCEDLIGYYLCFYSCMCGADTQ